MYAIAIDTCNLRQDPRPESAIWTEFRAIVSSAQLSIVIPEVVVDEFSNHLQLEENKRIDQFNKQLEKLSVDMKRYRQLGLLNEVDDLLSQIETISVNRLSSVTAKENTMVLMQKLFGQSFSRLPYPTLEHSDVVQRCLAERRPFANRDRDRGYRDNLLWHSICDYLSATQMDVIFVSNNPNDFADETGNQLHSDLLQDIDSGGLVRDRLKYFKQLNDLFDSNLLSTRKHLSELATLLTIDKDGKLNVAFRNCRYLFIENVLKFLSEKALPSQHPSTAIQGYREPVLISVNDVIEQPNSEVILDCECSFITLRNVYYSLANSTTGPVEPHWAAWIIRSRLFYDRKLNRITAVSIINAVEDDLNNCFVRTQPTSSQIGSIDVLLLEPKSWTTTAKTRTFNNYNEFRQAMKQLGANEQSITSEDSKATNAIFLKNTSKALLKKWQLI